MHGSYKEKPSQHPCRATKFRKEGFLPLSAQEWIAVDMTKDVISRMITPFRSRAAPAVETLVNASSVPRAYSALCGQMKVPPYETGHDGVIFESLGIRFLAYEAL
jgi:hypothetical protein